MTTEGPILVTVICFVYNHETYLRDCLDGFVMQKTNFRFVVIVHDDCSTDNSANIISEYENKCPDIIKPIYAAENQYSKLGGNLCSIMNSDADETGAKYIALCEGDDYWTDPYKLQKQVDFMETHEDYSMCFHKVEVIGDEDLNHSFSGLNEGDYTAFDIYDKWQVATCSVLYRNVKKIEIHSSIVFGDIYLYLQLAEIGKLYCLDFIGGVYRRHDGSASCGYPYQTCIRLYYQYLYFEKRFPELRDISRRKQDEQGLKGIIYAPYFKGIWKYRFLYMIRHPRLFFTTFFSTTILSYTPLREFKFWK